MSSQIDDYAQDCLPGMPPLPEKEGREAERFTEAELVRAWKDLDRVHPEYNAGRLREICLQVLKNRLWDKAISEGKL